MPEVVIFLLLQLRKFSHESYVQMYKLTDWLNFRFTAVLVVFVESTSSSSDQAPLMAALYNCTTLSDNCTAIVQRDPRLRSCFEVISILILLAVSRLSGHSMYIFGFTTVPSSSAPPALRFVGVSSCLSLDCIKYIRSRLPYINVFIGWRMTGRKSTNVTGKCS